MMVDGDEQHVRVCGRAGGCVVSRTVQATEPALLVTQLTRTSSLVSANETSCYEMSASGLRHRLIPVGKTARWHPFLAPENSSASGILPAAVEIGSEFLHFEFAHTRTRLRGEAVKVNDTYYTCRSKPLKINCKDREPRIS